ncbi:MAG: molybdopterin-synthase adenylyltransferase MoeB [Halodesulfurarchaeum sp.]
MSDLNLDQSQLQRYSRHIIMDGVGTAGQRALLESDVLVVGAGGLGSPVIAYLAAAGVGTMHIVDADVLERSNLQRQVIHTDADVGRPKVESAREFVESLNPDVDVHTHEVELGPENVGDLVEGRDFVVDCSDNFRTRYIVNDACTLAGIPFAHGSVYRFEGQITTFDSDGEGPCYRCLFPEAPPEDQAPDCSTAGVLGVLPGTVGTIQATETIKGLIEAGTSLDGRLVIYDAFDLTFEEIEIRPDPDCPVCGENPSISSVGDVEYTGSCAIE